MGLFDVFKKRGKIIGRVTLENLPQPRMAAAATIGFFPVASAAEELPWLSPPAELIKDEVRLNGPDDPDPAGRPLTFSVERPAGFYYIVVGVIVFRQTAPGKALADIKRYFPPQEPIEVSPHEPVRTKLAFDWNAIPDDALKHRGTVEP